MFERFLQELLKDMDESMNTNSKSIMENENNNEEEPHSYFYCLSEKYKDGERVFRKEKEIKDGKVIKDEGESLQVEDKQCKCNNEDKCGKKSEKLQLKEKDKTISVLEDNLNACKAQIITLEEENKKLKETLNKIKSMF